MQNIIDIQADIQYNGSYLYGLRILDRNDKEVDIALSSGELDESEIEFVEKIEVTHFQADAVAHVSPFNLICK